MERIQAALKKARESRTQQSEGSISEQVDPAGKSDTRKDAPLVLTHEVSVSEREETWKQIKQVQPRENLLRRNRIVSHRSCPEAIPYDVMRTKLLQQMRKNKWSRVAITSPRAGAGKTMTTLNLALSLSRQSDLFTMLLELDMRSPSIARTIGITDDCQFSRALAEEDQPEDHLRRVGRNLIIGTNKTTARNPAELLQGQTAAQVMDKLEKRFKPDIIIFDTPPLFAGDDTMAFLDQVDCALLIAEAERSTVEEIDKSEQELSARTNVLGVMLNKCRYLSQHEGYGKEYGY